MSIKLYDHQLEALSRMKNGCILCGGVGSGKSITALSYYYILEGGSRGFLKGGDYIPMKDPPKDLYIITTARKRDTMDWEKEMIPFLLSSKKEFNLYTNQVKVDSWNNIGKYRDVENAFFIFDEQRVVGSGAWVKAFLKITKKNQWILLSATPGDTWSDYIPVFIANGFYKNRTEFLREHVIYSRFTKYPKIERYIGTGKLIKYRKDILVEMDFVRPTASHHETVWVDYNKEAYKDIGKRRWNVYKNEPIRNASELCYVWRRVVNSDISRQNEILTILENHPKLIIFYNFNYERDILLKLFKDSSIPISEWSGHRHEDIPKGKCWVYLVQYSAGAEGWNCIETDTIVFYSQNYSYKIMQQASGRIDRLNTPFKDLYFYHFISRSSIDLAISKALKNKKNFNEGNFVKE